MVEKEIIQELDLRGVKCPLNFVKVKLKLEELQPGVILEILLDDGEPILNVPRSIKEDGHEILAAERVEEHYRVKIRKA